MLACCVRKEGAEEETIIGKSEKILGNKGCKVRMEALCPCCAQVTKTPKRPPGTTTPMQNMRVFIQALAFVTNLPDGTG